MKVLKKLDTLEFETLFNEKELQNFALCKDLFNISIQNLKTHNDEVAITDLESLKLVILAIDELYKRYSDVERATLAKKKLLITTVQHHKEYEHSLKHLLNKLNGASGEIESVIEQQPDNAAIRSTYLNYVREIKTLSKELMLNKKDIDRFTSNAEFRDLNFTNDFEIKRDNNNIEFTFLIQIQNLFVKNGLTPLSRLQIQNLLITNQEKTINLWGDDDEGDDTSNN